MMKTVIKICGLSTPETVAAAVGGGASHAGFIFFAKSPRNVEIAQAAALAAGIGGRAQSVAVTVDAADDFLDRIVDGMKPGILQLHGSETPDRVGQIGARFGLPVMKAIAIRDAYDIARARQYEGVADLLLFDAKPPAGSELPGGNGVSFDWTLLENFRSQTPVLLSGGIDQDNLSQALDLVHVTTNAITGIDVSSGVESAPGVKDIEKIEALLAACAEPLHV